MTLQGIMWDVGREREGESSHTAGIIVHLFFFVVSFIQVPSFEYNSQYAN
jgi:hypothetical protein